MMLPFPFLVLLLMIPFISSQQLSPGPHLADVNVLLPPKITHPVEYRLQGSDGCFKWSWDHHDILSVIPEYNGTNHCSTSARLRSIAAFSGRKETAVYAADVYTGVVIRCKVFIDNVSRIQIFHNSVKLDLDGLATLRVRAFDREDNVFSSLVGLQFMWELRPDIGGLTHHLIHVPLKDSPLSDCGGLCGDLNIQIKLEDSGVFSDLFVVKGIGIGHESVSVHLLEPHFDQLADKIVLTVAEAMSLEPPSPVFVLVGAAFHFTLKVMRANVQQAVILPSPHHRWTVLNSSVAEVHPSMGFTRALNLGVTSVIVEDIRVASHTQVSSLNVVLPDSLYLYMIPLSISGDPMEGIDAIPSLSRWYVVSGRSYLIQMKVFARGPDPQEIYITESDHLKFHDEESEHWSTVSLSEDIAVKYSRHNSRILKAASQGIGKFTASLTYVGTQKETKKVAQEIHVCSQVKFNFGKMNGPVLLPWAPDIYQELVLKVTGGCAKALSDYKWFSSDVATLSVSTNGVVQAKKPGKATVKVVSIFDSLNYDEVVIEVSIPSNMIMLQNFPVETVVGSILHAAVTMKTSDGAYFYRCDAFHQSIKWKAACESFAILNATEKSLDPEQLHSVYGPPCSWTDVYASGPGQTMLHATLSKEYHDLHRPMVLKSSLRIAAYQPLTVHQVGDGNQFGGYWFDLDDVEATNNVETLERLYLVPGASLDVLLHGGPEPWEKDVDFMETVEVFDDEHGLIKDKVYVHQVSVSNQSLYRVFCHSLGAFKVVFKRGNLVGDDHSLPAVAEVTLSLRCSLPSSITLMVDKPVNKRNAIRSATLADRSTRRIHSTPVIVANGQTVRIAAVGISSSGEAFANSSSISLNWELSSCEGLAYWDDAYESKRSKSSWERFLALENESGQCIVRATVSGFDDTMDSHHYAQMLNSEEVLTDAIRLKLVSTLRVNPEFNLLYFNPDAKVNLSVTGGSCLWETMVNDSQVVEVMEPPSGLRCLQLTLSPKGFGIANLTIYDVGLTTPAAASAVVRVAEVDWIEIVSGKKMSLMEGQSQAIDLRAGTNDGSTFDSYQYAYMDVRVYIKDDIVELVDNAGILNPLGGFVNAPSFEIRAKRLGMTTLFASVRQQSGQEIFSQKIQVEVFEPLRISPQDIFLVPGASYQLMVKGGPVIDGSVEYISMNDGVARVNKSSGLLFALSPGGTTIVARVHGNRDVVICHASGSVKVGVPSLAILNAQSEQLGVGREMPVYPYFPEGDLFSFYGLCTEYIWRVDDEKVLSFKMEEILHFQKHRFSLDGEKEHAFIKFLYGRSAGRTNVAVKFSCDFTSTSYSQSKTYDASLSLLVVPDLPLALGVPMTWLLPPRYVTSSLLPSSPDTHGEGDSQIHKGTIIYSLLRSCERHEDWKKDTITIDGNRIKTTESKKIACIQAKDQTTGKIEIASCVRVAEVAQIRISSDKVPRHIIYLAVGAELDIPISYFDALGNPFYEARSAASVHAETNYHNIVSIDDEKNGSGNIHLKALRHGKALVRVSMDSNPLKSDYLLISVGAHLDPQSPVLHQGSSLNFGMEGIALSIDGPKTLTNVHNQTKGYSFSVSFSGRDNMLKTSGDKQRVVHDCKVDPSFVGYAKPWMDFGTGTSYCLFFPHSPEQLGLSVPKLKDTRPSLSVFVNASLIGANHVSGSASASASATFIGGFSIMEMNKGLLQLNLTPNSSKAVITILGNTDVEINWLDRDSIQISLIRKEEFGISGRAQYEVKVLGDKSVKDKIIIKVPVIGQREEIDVNYEPGTKASDDRTFQIILAVFFWLLVLVLPTFVCVYMNRTRPYVPPPPPRTAEPQTPVSGASVASDSTVVTGHSPRTPPAFVEYLRRTIDETPYYTREARRRINPQNTF